MVLVLYYLDTKFGWVLFQLLSYWKFAEIFEVLVLLEFDQTRFQPDFIVTACWVTMVRFYKNSKLVVIQLILSPTHWFCKSSFFNFNLAGFNFCEKSWISNFWRAIFHTLETLWMYLLSGWGMIVMVGLRCDNWNNEYSEMGHLNLRMLNVSEILWYVCKLCMVSSFSLLKIGFVCSFM